MEQAFVMPNITPGAMFAEKTYDEKKTKENFNTNSNKNSEDYKKNYLDIQLAEGEKKKVLTIRLLPMDMSQTLADGTPNPSYGTPFVHVYSHNVKVNKEVSPSGYRNYLCLSKTQGIDSNTFGTKCPCCEMNWQAHEEGKKETDPIKKKEWFKLSCSYLAKETVIVRCIDRNHEEDGVKFWKFNLRDDEQDPYHQIISLWQLRAQEGKAVGQDINILDVMNGVDLTVTITEGTSAPVIQDGRISRPVSTDPNQLNAWLYDTKKWQEVFTAKPYNYLSLVINNKIPWKNKMTGEWVDKELFMNEQNNSQKQNPNLIYQQPQYAEQAFYGNQYQQPVNSGSSLLSQMTINDSDLPL